MPPSNATPHSNPPHLFSPRCHPCPPAPTIDPLGWMDGWMDPSLWADHCFPVLAHWPAWFSSSPSHLHSNKTSPFIYQSRGSRMRCWSSCASTGNDHTSPVSILSTLGLFAIGFSHLLGLITPAACHRPCHIWQSALLSQLLARQACCRTGCRTGYRRL